LDKAGLQHYNKTPSNTQGVKRKQPLNFTKHSTNVNDISISEVSTNKKKKKNMIVKAFCIKAVNIKSSQMKGTCTQLSFIVLVKISLDV
jgi:hypothetical protein